MALDMGAAVVCRPSWRRTTRALQQERRDDRAGHEEEFTPGATVALDTSGREERISVKPRRERRCAPRWTIAQRRLPTRLHTRRRKDFDRWRGRSLCVTAF